MSHYDFPLQSQCKQHPRPNHKKSKSFFQPIKMVNTKTKIISNLYFRDVLFQISNQQTTNAINHFEQQISINNNPNRRENFLNDFGGDFSQEKKQQMQDKSKYPCLAFEKYSSDYVHTMRNAHDGGLKDCFNQTPSFRIFDVRSGPFQSPRIEEQFQI